VLINILKQEAAIVCKVLSAPTRREVVWLDMGVLSLRNMG